MEHSRRILFSFRNVLKPVHTGRPSSVGELTAILKYLLTVVDILSKYAWVVPMKKKTGAEQKCAFESILKEGRKPLRLQTDKGSEFYNKLFQEYLTHQKITHFNTQ